MRIEFLSTAGYWIPRIVSSLICLLPSVFQAFSSIRNSNSEIRNLPHAPCSMPHAYSQTIISYASKGFSY